VRILAGLDDLRRGLERARLGDHEHGHRSARVVGNEGHLAGAIDRNVSRAGAPRFDAANLAQPSVIKHLKRTHAGAFFVDGIGERAPRMEGNERRTLPGVRFGERRELAGRAVYGADQDGARSTRHIHHTLCAPLIHRCLLLHLGRLSSSRAARFPQTSRLRGEILRPGRLCADAGSPGRDRGWLAFGLGLLDPVVDFALNHAQSLALERPEHERHVDIEIDALVQYLQRPT